MTPRDLLRQLTSASPALKRGLAGVLVGAGAVYALTYLPWQPVLVTSASVPRGLYLVRPADSLQRGDFVAFRYAAPAWAKDRGYAWNGRTFVKQALGLPGDRVVLQGVQVSVCTPAGACRPAGELRVQDSAGRPMSAYADQDYTLKPGEFYAGALFNPKSYDSRYYGPVSAGQVLGRAVPVWTEG